MTPSTSGSATTPSSAEQLLIPSLPNDVAIRILAHVPLTLHPTLSSVCKSFRALLKSSFFHSTRSLLLRRTQSTLLFSVRSPNSSFRWFTLSPHRPPSLVSPILPSSPIGSALCALGSVVYLIGGSVNDVGSRTTWVLDFEANEWVPGPRMRVGREFPAAGVVNDKIYVMGGCLIDTWAKLTHWAEVFDPEIGEWTSLDSPIEIRAKWMHACAVIRNRVYAMADRGGVWYDNKESVWGNVEGELDLGWKGSGVGIGNVLYCYDYLGKIRGFDMEDGMWKEVKGIEKGLPRFLCGAMMANLDERLLVSWEGKDEGRGEEMEIWSAEIEVWKGKDGGLRGSIEWSDVVLVVPRGSTIVHCLAVKLS